MQSARGALLRLEHISKTYPNGVIALQELNLDVPAGEWLVLVGPSGCGKTTTLRIIAGLEDCNSGTVRIGDRIVNPVPPWKRGVAMVFQRPALAPTYTVRQNLNFGAPEENRTLVSEMADFLGLRAELERLPHQLSGGQQQRVALGRALIRRASVYLLDEPLAHLDAPLRDALRRELKVWHASRAATVVSVTHDPREAWALGQRVAVMDDGQVLQVGPPAEIYARPRNRFVAAFFSEGPMNFFDADLRREGNLLQWTITDWPEPISAGSGCLKAAGAVTIGIRAEDIRVGVDGLPARVLSSEQAPSGQWVTVQVGERRITGRADAKPSLAHGQVTRIAMDWKKANVFERVTGETLNAPLG